MERLCALYGYGRIQTPGFEDTELFKRTSGAGSDIVQKEMYTFEDRGRPLAHASSGGNGADLPRLRRARHAPRAAAGEAVHDRADVPLRGAAARPLPRALTSSSLESIGSADPAVDAEVIQYYDALLRNLGVARYELQLNSIGDRNCRPAYVEKLNEWLDAHADVLDDDARQKRATSPLRVFDVKNERVRAALQDAPKIGESLCDECAQHFDAGARLPRRVRRRLHARADARSRSRLLHAHDLRVRRARREHAGSTICGGGRYDYLVEEIGGPPTPASASAPASSGSSSRSSSRASPQKSRCSTSSSSLEAAEHRGESCLAAMTELRAKGSRATPTMPAAR